MTTTAHRWAIGHDDMGRADQVRDKIARLGWGPGQAGKYLLLYDLAVVVDDKQFQRRGEPDLCVLRSETHLRKIGS